MNKFIIKYFFLIVILISIASCKDVENIQTPVVKNGVIDLRRWDFSKNGNIKLDGEWEFYWKELLSNDEFKNGNKPKTFIPVPGFWNAHIHNNKKIGDYGYGTYRVKVLLKDGEKKLI